MIKFEKQESDAHIWVVAFDTVFSGWNCAMSSDDEICLFTSEDADKEVDEDPEVYFKIKMDEYLHERKAIFDESGGSITGIKPLKK